MSSMEMSFENLEIKQECPDVDQSAIFYNSFDVEVVVKEEPSLDINDNEILNQSQTTSGIQDRAIARCNVCLETFENKKKALDHSQTMHPDKECDIGFKCLECDEFFETLVAFNDHEKLSHQAAGQYESKKDSKIYDCQQCNFSFKQKFVFLKHMSLDIHKPTLECEFCSELFSDKKDVFKHLFSKHFEKLCCFGCIFAFPDTVSLKNHLKTHSGASKKCIICDRLYTTEADLRNHVTRKHKIKCGECEQLCESKSILTKHLIEHNHRKENITVGLRKKEASSNAKCKICDRVFTRTRQLKSHFQLMHPESNFEVEFECEVCGEVFESTSTLKVHQKEHQKLSNEKKFQSFKCFICNITFLKKLNLKKHNLSVHDKSGAGNYECYVCAKTFKGIKSKKEHFESEHPGLNPKIEPRFYEYESLSETNDD